MSLTVDDEVTLVEIGVIAIGIAIAWAVYRVPSSSFVRRGTPQRTRPDVRASDLPSGDRGKAP